MGIVSLLALAAVGYGSYYTLVGRFYVSTDDAYVRANNTMLGARVSGHIAAILPGDNVLTPGTLQTFVADGARARTRAYERVREEIVKGRQCFVVCPLVSESEALQAADRHRRGRAAAQKPSSAITRSG